jgi:hypothetical protein
MALSKQDKETLKHQGLKEDIRNQLSNPKNIPYLFDAWKKEKNTERKKGLFIILNKSIKQLKKNVNHICDSLDLYEFKEKTG